MKQKHRFLTLRLVTLSVLFVLISLIPAAARYRDTEVVINYEAYNNVPAAERDDTRGFDIIYTHPIVVTAGEARVPQQESTGAGAVAGATQSGTTLVVTGPVGWYAFEMRGGWGGSGPTHWDQAGALGGEGGQGGWVQGVFFFGANAPGNTATITLMPGRAGPTNMYRNHPQGSDWFGGGIDQRTNAGGPTGSSGGGGASLIFDGVFNAASPYSNLVAIAGGGGGGGSGHNGGTANGNNAPAILPGAASGGASGAARNSAGTSTRGLSASVSVQNGNPSLAANLIIPGGHGGGGEMGGRGGGQTSGGFTTLAALGQGLGQQPNGMQGGTGSTNNRDFAGGSGGGGYYGGWGGTRGLTWGSGGSWGAGGGGGASFLRAGVRPFPAGNWPQAIIPNTRANDRQVIQTGRTVPDVFNGWITLVYLGPRFPGEPNSPGPGAPNYRGPNNGFLFN